MAAFTYSNYLFCATVFQCIRLASLLYCGPVCVVAAYTRVCNHVILISLVRIWRNSAHVIYIELLYSGRLMRLIPCVPYIRVDMMHVCVYACHYTQSNQPVSEIVGSCLLQWHSDDDTPRWPGIQVFRPHEG